MSVDSWHLLDTEYANLDEKKENIQDTTISSTMEPQRRLNFDRFKGLNADYSSPDVSDIIDKNTSTENNTSNENDFSTDQPHLSISPSSIRENDKMTPILSPPLPTIAPTSSSQQNYSTTIYSPQLVSSSSQHTMHSHDTSLNVHNTTTSHADAFASWTPPRTTTTSGAAIPWLFGQPTNQTENDIDTLKNDFEKHNQALREKWKRMHQQKLSSSSSSNHTNTTGPPLPANSSSVFTPSFPPSHTINNDNDGECLDFIHHKASQLSLSSSPSINNNPMVFQFSGLVGDQRQALDSIMLRIHQQIPAPLSSSSSSSSSPSPWHTLRSLDLSHQHLTSIQHLDTLTPLLEVLIISHNQIRQLSDIPSSLKIMKAKSNKLTDIEGFRYLHKLEYLDICDNALDSFDGIGPFYYLRTLLVENNKLKCCLALQQMHGLVVLKLRGNAIEHLKFDKASLYQLESLDLSYNRVRCLESLNGVPKLYELNLDNNQIDSVALDKPVDTLRVLKLNYNRLQAFDGRFFPNLRTLYLDSNRLVRIVDLRIMQHLDSISLRDQGGSQLQVNVKELQSTRKLYLSGMPVKQLNHMIHFNTLEYLEISSAQLEELPSDFGSQVPLLRVLYLSHNYLKQLNPLIHHRRLQRLVLIDNRLQKLGDILDTIRTLPRLNYLDIR
ncbi:uncharacterized protein BX664DRAFT_326229 [Halteromyces radiatus]|uniref:uncharacterized protein n=1 Tax=Halteromyces radiatus TaxID=101107 RepID=UPI00222007D2|nr:uncharacterized protein BX664DRAFT_326229 [Halteromyces radiatus]KAI8097376.1 hypothetical protein BX664DRAFT_326229 [Halteromyces radiatus]